MSLSQSASQTIDFFTINSTTVPSKTYPLCKLVFHIDPAVQKKKNRHQPIYVSRVNVKRQYTIA